MWFGKIKIKVILLTGLLVLATAVCSAQIYRSKKAGNWNDPTVWESSTLGILYFDVSVAPNSTNSGRITIQSGHTVVVTATTDGKEISVAGVLTVNPGVTLTVVDAIIVDDMTVTGTLNLNGTLQNPGGTVAFNGTTTIASTGVLNNVSPATLQNNSGSTLSVNGIINNSGTITNATTGTVVNVAGSIINTGTITSTATNLQFNNGGFYIHDYTTAAGAIPAATWNNGSMCEIRGYTTNTTLPAGLTTPSFYNFRWSCANQVSPIALVNASFTTRGDFIMSASGTSASLQLNNSALTIQRDYIQTGGIFDMNSGVSPAASVINIAGNYTMNGGTLRKSGTGTGNVYFNGTTRQIFTKSLPATATIAAQPINFTVNANAIVDFNTSILDGSTGTFTLSNGGTLITANAAGIASTGLTGSIQSTGTRLYSQTANYWYDTNVAQNTGSGLPAVVNNLTVSKVGSGVTLSPASSSLTVNGVLTMTSGFFDLTTTPLLLGGSSTTAGTGMLITQNTSTLPIPTGKTWAFGVTYNANSGTQTLVPGTFGGLTMSNAAIKNGQTGSLSVTGNWNSSGGKLDFTSNNTAVAFTGTGAQSIVDAGSDANRGVFFNSLTFSGAGTKTLSATGSGKFSVTSTGLLSMAGTAVLAGGGVIYLKSDVNGTANVGAIPVGASITGVVNAETFLTGNGVAANRGTRMISASVNASNIYAQLKNSMFITGPGGVANGFDAGGSSQPFAVTLTKYVESKTTIPAQSQFQNVLTLSEAPPTPGNAFFVFFRGARDANGTSSTKLNLPYAAPENVVTNFAGTLNQGNVAVTLSYTVFNDGYDGYNAVGNPYASAIDWTKVTRTANIDNMVSVIKPGGGMTTYSAGVVTNAAPALTGGAPTTSTPGFPFIIQPGQGFYVKARATGQILTFTESAKVTTQSVNRLLDAPSDNTVVLIGKEVSGVASTNAVNNTSNDALRVLKISLKDAVNIDETAIVFKQGYQENYGADDATYFSGSTVSLASLTSEKMAMAINFMPELTSSTELKLSVNTSANGAVSLIFDDISGTAGKVMSLKDHYLNTTTKISANGVSYSFTVDKAVAASFGTERFALVFEDEKLPPAPLLSFTAEKGLSNVKLKWMSAGSTQDLFVLERSADGVTFAELASMDGANATTKTYLDQKPLSGKNHYRVVQVDDLNHKTYSAVLMIEYQTDLPLDSKATFTVYPNPAVDEIRVALKEKGSVKVNVYNLSGTLLTQKAFGADDTVRLDVSTLMRGMHVLEVKSAGDNALIGTSKFFKN